MTQTYDALTLTLLNFPHQLVCIIVENESDVAAFKDFKDDAPPAAGASAPAPPPPKVAAAPPPPPPKAAPAPSPTPVPPQKTSGGTRVYASPLAKRLAAEKGLDLSVSTFLRPLVIQCSFYQLSACLVI